MTSFIDKNWITPSSTYFKVNIDGAFQPTTRNFSFDGLIQHNNDNYCIGFYGNLDTSNVLFAKAWTPLYGIRVTRNLGPKKFPF